jgi:signal peptidase I
MKKSILFILEVIKIVVLAAVIVIPIRYFLFQPFFVQGISMEPNFQNGDYLIIDEISYRLREPQRGEVIVFKYPQNPSQRYIKRIIGLPGETIEVKDNQVIIFDGQESQVLDESNYLPSYLKTPGNVRLTLKEDQYFVLGDNRTASFDSRRWGPLPAKNIVGRVAIRAWPLTAFAEVITPDYNY